MCARTHSSVRFFHLSLKTISYSAHDLFAYNLRDIVAFVLIARFKQKKKSIRFESGCIVLELIVTCCGASFNVLDKRKRETVPLDVHSCLQLRQCIAKVQLQTEHTQKKTIKKSKQNTFEREKKRSFALAILLLSAISNELRTSFFYKMQFPLGLPCAIFFLYFHFELTT